MVSSRDAVGDDWSGRELVGVCLSAGGVELEGDRTGGMIDAIAERHDGEDQQRADLNAVDGKVDRGGAVDSAMGDVRDGKGIEDGARHHEEDARVGGAHKAGIEGADDEAGEDAHDPNHDARIDPVVEMGGPSDNELGDAGVLPCLVVVEEGLLGKVVGAARAGVELGHLGVTDRGGQAEQQRGNDAGPHGRAGGAGCGLDGKGKPKECARSNQRHRVAGESGKAQRFFHLACGFICHVLS